MPADLDRLRAVIEAMTPEPWEREHAEGPPGGWVVSRVVVPDGEDVFRGASIEDERGLVALRNVAPELLACAIALATIREDALADLAHYRARAAGGQVARLPQYTASQATRIERETRCLDALDARIREAVPEETERA